MPRVAVEEDEQKRKRKRYSPTDKNFSCTMYTSVEPFTTPIICAKIHCMAWLPDADGGGLLATGNTSSAVSVAIVNESEKKSSTNPSSNSYKVCVLKPVLSSISHPIRPQLKDVTHVSWSRKYQFLASCHGYNHVLIWDRHGNRVTNKPVVIIRDEVDESSRVVPAVTVRWAHAQPTLLITYEDGVMKLVKVTSETNSSHISVDNISFSDAYYNRSYYDAAEDMAVAEEGEEGGRPPITLRSSCWSYDDRAVYSAAANSTELVVTNVAERRMVARIPLDIRVEGLFSWYCEERGQLIYVHHPCSAVTILTVDGEYRKTAEKLVLTPFSIGTTKVAVRQSDGLMAVGGMVNCEGASSVRVYHHSGSLMKRVQTPCDKPITALCWVGRSSLSVATKNHVHNITVSKTIPTLEYLASLVVPKTQKRATVPLLPPDMRVNFELTRRTLPKNTPRVFSDTESASQCTLRVVKGSNSLHEAQFMVAEVGGEAVAIRAIKQTALMSLGVHYEILLRNDCLRTDEEQLALINRQNCIGSPRVLNCSYSKNFTLALRMSHKSPLSRGTTQISSLGGRSTLFYELHYSEKRSLLSVRLYSSASGELHETPYLEASGTVIRPTDEEVASNIVLQYENKEVFQLLKWQRGSYSVRYKSPFSMCAAFCTAVNCISRKLI